MRAFIYVFTSLLFIFAGCGRERQNSPSSERQPIVITGIDSLSVEGSAVFLKLHANSPLPEALCKLEGDVIQRLDSSTITTFVCKFEIPVSDSVRSQLGHYEVTPTIHTSFAGWNGEWVRFRFWQGGTSYLDTILNVATVSLKPPVLKRDSVAELSRQVLATDLIVLAGRAQAYYRASSASAGGGNSFLGLTIDKLTRATNPPMSSRASGRFSIERISPFSVTIVGIGKTKGSDGKNPVKVIARISPDFARTESWN